MKNRFLTSLVLFLTVLTSSQTNAQTLWGVTSAGVADNKGVIFKSNNDGSGYTVQHTFITDFPGSTPYNSLTLANGKFYGTTYSGGAHDHGVIFEFDPATGVYTKKVDFDVSSTGAFPQGGMVLASDGLMYGTTIGGGSNLAGILYSYLPGASTITPVYSFSTTTGAFPNGNMIQAANNKLYGMTPSGGANGFGVIYQYDISLGYSVVHDFDGANGSVPYGDLVEFTNGMLYGLTSVGTSAPSSKGVLFEFNPSNNNFVVKQNLSPIGENPYGSLVKRGTTLWGLTFRGGANNQGVLFEYDPAGNTITKRNDFATASGGSPLGSLFLASNGLMYGMTSVGGSNGDGVLFEYNPTLHTFPRRTDLATLTTGSSPQFNNVVEASNGKLYGLIPYGGPSNNGTLFEYDPTPGTFTKKVDFSNASGGSNPQGSMILASNGLLYGLASNGGANGQGVLYSFDPAGSGYTKIIDLSYTTNGAYPSGSLVEASNGKLYGMSPYGGINDNGVLFEYNPVGDYFFNRIDFSAATTGSNPQGSLVAGTNGKLYGTTSHGGANGLGTFFEFDINTLTITQTISFAGSSNGSTPTGSMVLAANGKMYGMTNQGGSSGNGVIFEFNTTTGVLTKKLDFSATNGANPYGELMQATDGKLYGMTSAGGSNGVGVIFRYDQVANSITKVFDFDGTNSGSGPFGGLTEVGVGKLFGMNASGGANGVGVYFHFDIPGNTFSKSLDFGGANGASPQYATVTIVPAKSPQTITFNALPNKMYNDAPFALTGTTSSGLPITYVSSNPAIASISGNTVTINSFGTVTITASQYGNGTFTYAQDVVQPLVITRASQTITFSIPAKIYGDPDFLLTATASSGLAVSYVSADPSIASIVGSTITIHKAGSVNITASQAGNAVYDPAPDVQKALVISKADQTITFVQPAVGTLGVVSFNQLQEILIGTASSSLTVNYTSSPAGILSITGNVATFLTAGAVTITAHQPGDGNYNAAPDVSKTLTINPGTQTITFGPLSSKTYGDIPFDLTATSDSGLPITYNSTDATVVSIVGSTVTILKAGAITITASQPGNGGYGAATPVNQALNISKASQTITFGPLAAKNVSDPDFTLTATASSLLPVSYASDNIAVATIVSGNQVHIVGIGTANITASQSGDTDHFLAAASVPQTLTVNNKLSQTITFNALPTKNVTDAPFTLSATATSSLSVSFASSDPAVATVSGTTVTIVGAGTTIITASQAGNGTYNPAPDVPQNLVVQTNGQTITFGALPSVTLGDAPFNLTATASSGLPVAYTAITPSKISITGNVVTILAAGSATIRASQPGDTNNAAATPVDRTFCIKPAKPVVTVSNQTSSTATLTSDSPTGNQWYKFGVAIPGATGQVLNLTTAGTYQVIVTVESCSSVFSDAQSPIVTGDITSDRISLLMYPNPAKDKLYVDLTPFNTTPVQVKSLDITGRETLSEVHSGGQTIEIDVSKYAAGTYLIILTQEDQAVRARWIKQ